MPFDDLNEASRAPLYTRPCQLPPNVAFEILEYANVSKRNSNDKTHRITVKNDGFISLMIYPGARFATMTAERIAEFNAEITAGNKFFLVARRWTSVDRVPLDILSEEKRQAQHLPVYDCDIHLIKAVDSNGDFLADSMVEKSPSKRPKREF